MNENKCSCWGGQPLLSKGFTLIELLAVIVVLAIIAIIATPIILNIIKDSKEESNKRSVEMYVKALQNSITKYQMDNNENIIGKLNPKELDNNEISKNIITNEDIDLKIDYEGNVVCDVIEVYEDGNIYITECKVNGEPIEYTYGKDQSYDNGQIVYFDVVKGKGCTKEEYESSFDETIGDYLNSKTGYNGYINRDPSDNAVTPKLNNQNSCLKFYAFNDNINSKSLNLLLDHNTSKSSWTNFEKTTNETGPIDIISELKVDTNKWNGTIIPKNYEYISTQKKYTIDYSQHKARLITADEVSKIVGADKLLDWKENVANKFYYFHNLTDNSETGAGNVCVNNGCKYGWLYDRLGACKKYGCLNEGNNPGYWTSAVRFDHPTNVWVVYNSGSLYINHATLEFGVRPVIEVLKSKL